MLPIGVTTLPRAEAWSAVCHGLGIPESPAIGDRIEADSGDGLRLAGTVVKTSASAIALLVDAPASGTAFIAVEGDEGSSVSIWTYLYGPDAQAIVERDKPRWQHWIEGLAQA